MGSDFDKFKWEMNDELKTGKLLHFSEPEILSAETDYKYFNIEEQFFNLFNKKDLANIKKNGKKQVIEAAKKSHLPKVAADQMKILLIEVLYSKNWQIENPSLISQKELLIN